MENVLINKKVEVRPIYRVSNLPKGHDGEFMFTGAKATFTVPFDNKTKQLKQVLTVNEQKFFENLLGLEDGALNPSRIEKNYWHTFYVRLTKEVRTLDLNVPNDYLCYKVLLSNEDFIAPDWDSKYNKGSYRWALVDTALELKEEAKTTLLNKDCYIELGRMSGDRDKMMDFALVYYMTKDGNKRPPADATIELLIKKIGTIIEEDPKGFLEVKQDPLYEHKLLVQKCIAYGFVKSSGGRIEINGVDYSSTPAGMVEFFADLKNQEHRIKTADMISKHEKGVNKKAKEKEKEE